MRKMGIEIQDVNRVAHYKSIKDILYVKSKAHILMIYCDEDLIFTRQYSLEKLERVLMNSFVRCHKQYIVNMSKIQAYDKTLRLLNIGSGDIPVGRAYKEQVEKALEREHIGNNLGA